MSRCRGTTGIYIISHSISARVYIGQAQHIEKRWAVHKSFLRKNIHHCKCLQRMWRKYGGRGFRMEVLEICDADTLDFKEEYWMEFYSGRLANSAKVGGHARGYKLKKKARMRISEAQKKIGSDVEERKRRSKRARRQHKEGKFGRKTWTEESRKKFGKKMKKKGKKADKDLVRRIISLRKSGLMQHEIGSIVGLSQVMVSRVLRLNKVNIRVKKKVIHTEETKRKIAEGSKRYWSTAEARKKRSEIMKNLWKEGRFDNVNLFGDGEHWARKGKVRWKLDENGRRVYIRE